VVAVLPEFAFLGGRPALDFVNTELMEGPERVDLLRSDQTLLAWGRAAGLLSEPLSVAASATRIDPRAPALRVAIRAIFEARIDGKRPPIAALKIVNELLTQPTRAPALEFLRGRFVRSQVLGTTASELLQRIAVDAAQLLTESDRSLLRRCSNHRCILLFYDASKSGRRRWCSMGICGNRAKVAAHYERSKGRATDR
jgi:predicted RNA-binding Zn ribbon-like protein